MPADLAATAATPFAGPMVPLGYRVTDRREDTADSVTLSLVPIDDSIDDPEPGQFTMLYVFGVGEVPISVSGCPRHDGVLMHTVRAVGATSRALCRLGPGSAVGVRGPFGVGWDVSSAEGSDVLIVAGGIGLAPLRPVIREVLAGRERFGHVAILIGARSPDELLYADEIARWRALPDVHVEITVDAATHGWTGNVGLVTTLLERLPTTPSLTTAFVCGPEVMMRVVARNIVDSGADAGKVRLSLERNFQCAVRQCGHCQLGPLFVCADGPVVSWTTAAGLLAVRRW